MVVVWPDRVEVPALGQLAVGRDELAMLQAFASGGHASVESAATAAGWSDLAAAQAFTRRLRFGRLLQPTDRWQSAPEAGASGVAWVDHDLPVSLRCSWRGFEHIGHDGQVLARYDVDHVLALAATARGRRREPDHTRAQRQAFAQAFDRAEAAEQARVRAGAPRRIDVIPVSWTLGPPLALGLIFARIASVDGGRLTERYHLRPDWIDVSARLDHYTQRPAVYLCSAYVWSHVAVLELARRVKERSPGSLVVVGGPDVPKRPEAVADYLASRPEVDVAVRGEGEETAWELLDALASDDAGGFDRRSLTDVAGLATRIDGTTVRTPDRPRLEALDVVPSPFLAGWFDTYRAAPLDQVILESNRGCPYGCTFCDWGSATLSRIRRRGLERVLAELDWAASAQAEAVSFADANFGILARDVEIATHLADLRRHRGWPRGFGANFAKNTVKHLRPIIDVLVGAGIVNRGLLALQTTDGATLDAIERSNLPPEKYDAIAEEMQAAGLPFAVELMMGLPGQTVESFANDLQQCIDRELEGTVNPTTVLVNSPMNDPDYRQRWAVETAVAVGPGASAGVVATTTFTREDHHRMKALRRTFLAGENFGAMRHVDRLIRHTTGLREVEVLERIFTDTVEDPEGAVRHPFLRQLLNQGTPALVVPVSWRWFVDDLVAYVRRTYPSVDEGELRTVARVQHALLPAFDRRYPQRIVLDHDYPAWFAQVRAAKAGGHRLDWPTVVPPLRTFGPTSLTVDDPGHVARSNIGCLVDHGSLLATWEHDSPVGRVRFATFGDGTPR
jgi:hypothetical protein